MSTNKNYFRIEKVSNRSFVKTVIVKVYVTKVYLKLQLILKESPRYLTALSSATA
jgi:hypothetical protein